MHHHHPLSTRFTKEYDLPFPFALAGMAFIGAADLAIAVNKAGGIGSIGVGPMPIEAMRSLIQQVKKATSRPPNVNFITFMATEGHIRACIEEQVGIVSFHWGHPPKKFIDQLKEAQIKVWQQVGSVKEAMQAVAHGIDLIIAQGSEAGGHNYGTLPTFVLVPEIVEAVRPVLVLAAGGITTGRQVAAALCLGADGVWVGTRMVASHEAFAHPGYKAKLVTANGTDTRLDSTFGPEWPFFNPTRVIENELTREFRGQEQLIPTSTKEEPIFGKATWLGKEFTLRRFSNFLPVPGTEANLEWMPLIAGQGVGMIRDIQPAEKIVRTMMEEAAATLAAFRPLTATP
jgi:NAD(P)H-dependent flavin oxidoreductase YrpB (nitropropane dioxygenase family)